jgi:hypothetical protein
MGIIKRPTADFAIISLEDEALLDCSHEQIHEYSQTRNIEVLEIDKLPIKPTIFWSSPLKPKYDHLLKREDLTHAECFAVFRYNVNKIENGPRHDDGTEIGFKTTHNERVVKANVQNVVPPLVIREIAEVIVEAASKDGDSLPFEPPPGSLLSWSQRISHRAMYARSTETAKQTSSASETTQIQDTSPKPSSS